MRGVLLILGAMAASLLSDIFIRRQQPSIAEEWDTLTALVAIVGLVVLIREELRSD